MHSVFSYGFCQARSLAVGTCLSSWSVGFYAKISRQCSRIYVGANRWQIQAIFGASVFGACSHPLFDAFYMYCVLSFHFCSLRDQHPLEKCD